jgi:co-chaperonin GroES (HSP10)|tara:strand:+ start:767 stop:1024 length:258 start_codon:yes stop_codon:yes gene_type:complete
MKAVNHYVVIEKIKETEKKSSGLIITEDNDNDLRYLKGKVISAGDLVEVIKQDDIVWYDKHAGHGIEFEEKFYFVIKASDIVLVD